MGDYHQRRDTCEITKKHRKKVCSGAEAVYVHQHPTPSRFAQTTGLFVNIMNVLSEHLKMFYYV